MTEKTAIPFNRPSIQGHESDYVLEAMTSGHISGDGPFTEKVQGLLKDALGVEKAQLTTSCTHALEMMAILLEFKNGDEIIVPDFTFVSTVNAFVLRGAEPVFIDIRPDTFNLDEKDLERKITSKTKAIVVVHYGGVGCEMDVVMDIARFHKVPILEDNAHGLFGKYKEKYLGTFGLFAAQSFHETKNFSCGEGGALLINDHHYIERAEIIREKGTDRSRFFRGQVDKYTWVDIGSSYLPSDILAAFLYGQLEQREKIHLLRKQIWERYYFGLKEWADKHSVQLPHVPEYTEQAYHLFHLLLPDLNTRQKLIDFLRERQIHAVFHYIPLHLSSMGMKFGGRPGDCPVAEDISERIIRLPFYNTLTASEQDYVIEAVQEFDF